MFDFFSKKPKKVTLEKLLFRLLKSEGEYGFETRESGPYREVKSKSFFLPIEFVNNEAIGVFEYDKKRIEIPISLEIKLPEERIFTLTENPPSKSKDNMLRLKLKPSVLLSNNGKNKCVNYQLDYVFSEPLPLMCYMPHEEKVKSLILVDNEPDIYEIISGSIIWEAGKLYSQLKQKPLIDKIELILPKDNHPITDAKIIKPNVLTNKDLEELWEYMKKYEDNE